MDDEPLHKRHTNANHLLHITTIRKPMDSNTNNHSLHSDKKQKNQEIIKISIYNQTTYIIYHTYKPKLYREEKN